MVVGGSAPFNYALSWSEFSSDTNIHMGGISGAPTSYPGHAFSGDSYGGRQGPAATAFGNSVYVAYTSTSPNGSGYNAINNVYFGSNGNFSQVVATNSSVVSNVNPALVTVPGSFANLSSAQSMILAVGTGAGGGFYSGPVDLLYYNPNSLEWTSFASPNSGANLNYPNAVFSPSLSYDAVAKILYLGYANVNDNTLVLCKTSNVSTPLNCNLLPGSGGMNFNPGMAVFNNTLYIAFESQANSHDLELYTSTDQGQSIQANNGLGSAQDQDQTSVGAIHPQLRQQGPVRWLPDQRQQPVFRQPVQHRRGQLLQRRNHQQPLAHWQHSSPCGRHPVEHPTKRRVQPLRLQRRQRQPLHLHRPILTSNPVRSRHGSHRPLLC